MRKKKVIASIVTAFCMASMFVMTASAQANGNGGGSVSTAITSTWTSAKTQIKTVVDNVVFPVIDVILAVLLFVKIATAYLEYRKHGQLEWTPIAIIFGGLLFSLTAPLYIWTII